LLRWYEGKAVFIDESDWICQYDPVTRGIEKYVKTPLDFPCALAVDCGYCVIGSTWEEIAVFEVGA